MLLSCFSRVWLCVIPETTAHQALLSPGFSRQEHWSGLPFPSPVHESEKWKWSRSVVSDYRDPIDCSLPGSSVHGIFQARILEWGSIAFSKFFLFLFFCYYRTLIPIRDSQCATHAISEAIAEFSKHAGILSAALWEHHLSGFEIALLEFHHLH